MKKIYIDKRVTVSGKQNTLDTANNLDLNKHIESVIEELDLVPYKKYVAMITQEKAGDIAENKIKGEDNSPVATILENTLGEIPVWSYVSTGKYLLTTTEKVFINGKVGVFFSSNGGEPFEGVLGVYPELSSSLGKNGDTINFFSANVDGSGNRTKADGLFKCMLQIIVYP
jgi:hypothetical protein